MVQRAGVSRDAGSDVSFGSGKPRTKAQQSRFDAIKEGPCLACKKLHLQSFYPEIHHLLSGGIRRGHDYSIGLCSYHHRGHIDARSNTTFIRNTYGPNLFDEAKKFHAEFGSDDELLEMQNQLIGVTE